MEKATNIYDTINNAYFQEEINYIRARNSKITTLILLKVESHFKVNTLDFYSRPKPKQAILAQKTLFWLLRSLTEEEPEVCSTLCGTPGPLVLHLRRGLITDIKFNENGIREHIKAILKEIICNLEENQ